MPPPANSSELLALLERSTLVEPAQIQLFLERNKPQGDLPEPPAELANRLMAAGLITRFHSDQLLAGRHKGFFVGKYKVLELIGQGGMGKVYLAEHKIMRRQVALKILPKSKGDDPSARARFQREARAVAALNHPNIVQAYDIDQDKDLHYIVMEYVEGMSVHEYVKAFGKIPWQYAAEYTAQAAEGLHHAHQAGLIHRDIKPGNLLIDVTGTIKLLDLGLAVFFEEKDLDPLTLRYDENVLGTADYLSPEQALDSHNVDIRADIYSLGGTLYYMLAGNAPFPDGTIAQKLLWHQSKPPRPVRELTPDVPEELQAVLMRMMAKKAADRIAAPLDVAEAMRPFAQRTYDPFQGRSPREHVLGPGSSKRRMTAPPPQGRPSDPPRPALQAAPRPAPPPGRSSQFPVVTGSAPAAVAVQASGRSTTDASPSVGDPTAGFEPIVEPILGTEVEPTASSTPVSQETASPRPRPAPFQASSEAEDDDAIGSSFDPMGAPDTAAPILAGPMFEAAAAAPRASSPAAQPSAAPMQPAGEAFDFLKEAAASSSRPAAPPPKSSRAMAPAAVDKAAKQKQLIAIGAAGAAALAVAAWFFLSGSGGNRNSKSAGGVVSKGNSPGESDSSPSVLTQVESVLRNRKPGKSAVVRRSSTGAWPQSTIRLTSEVVKEKLDLTGEGGVDEVVLKLTGAAPIIQIEDVADLSLRNFVLDGGGSAGPLVEIRGVCRGVNLNGLTFRNYKGAALRLAATSADAKPAVVLANLRFDHSDEASASLELAAEKAGGTVRGIQVEDCYFNGAFRAAIEARSLIKDFVVQQSTFEGGKTGIKLTAAGIDWSSVRIEKNTFRKLDAAVESTAFPSADYLLKSHNSIESVTRPQATPHVDEVKPGIPAQPVAPAAL